MLKGTLNLERYTYIHMVRMCGNSPRIFNLGASYINTFCVGFHAMNTFLVFTSRRRAQRDSNSPISYEKRVFLSRRNRGTIMSLIRGCSFRLGSLFPSAKRPRGQHWAELRPRYDVGIRRLFIIAAAFQRNSSSADNTRSSAAPRASEVSLATAGKPKNSRLQTRWRQRGKARPGYSPAVTTGFLDGASGVTNVVVSALRAAMTGIRVPY